MNPKVTEEQIVNLFMAEFWKRLAAWLVDQAILAPPIVLPLYLLSEGSYPLIETTQTLALLNLAYFTVLEGSWSQTIGKRLLGIVVYNENGRKVSYTSALIRRIGLVVPILQFFDAAVIFLTSLRQRIFDVVARTVVVKKEAKSDASKFLRGEDVVDSLVERGVIIKEPDKGVLRDRRTLEKLSEMMEEIEERFKEGKLEKEQYRKLKGKYEARIERLKDRLGDVRRKERQG